MVVSKQTAVCLQIQQTKSNININLEPSKDNIYSPFSSVWSPLAPDEKTQSPIIW